MKPQKSSSSTPPSLGTPSASLHRSSQRLLSSSGPSEPSEQKSHQRERDEKQENKGSGRDSKHGRGGGSSLNRQPSEPRTPPQSPSRIPLGISREGASSLLFRSPQTPPNVRETNLSHGERESVEVPSKGPPKYFEYTDALTPPQPSRIHPLATFSFSDPEKNGVSPPPRAQRRRVDDRRGLPSSSSGVRNASPSSSSSSEDFVLNSKFKKKASSTRHEVSANRELSKRHRYGHKRQRRNLERLERTLSRGKNRHKESREVEKRARKEKGSTAKLHHMRKRKPPYFHAGAWSERLEGENHTIEKSPVSLRSSMLGVTEGTAGRGHHRKGLHGNDGGGRVVDAIRPLDSTSRDVKKRKSKTPYTHSLYTPVRGMKVLGTRKVSFFTPSLSFFSVFPSFHSRYSRDTTRPLSSMKSPSRDQPPPHEGLECSPHSFSFLSGNLLWDLQRKPKSEFYERTEESLRREEVGTVDDEERERLMRSTASLGSTSRIYAKDSALFSSLIFAGLQEQQERVKLLENEEMENMLERGVRATPKPDSKNSPFSGSKFMKSEAVPIILKGDRKDVVFSPGKGRGKRGTTLGISTPTPRKNAQEESNEAMKDDRRCLSMMSSSLFTQTANPITEKNFDMSSPPKKPLDAMLLEGRSFHSNFLSPGGSRLHKSPGGAERESLSFPLPHRFNQERSSNTISPHRERQLFFHAGSSPSESTALAAEEGNKKGPFVDIESGGISTLGGIERKELTPSGHDDASPSAFLWIGGHPTAASRDPSSTPVHREMPPSPYELEALPLNLSEDDPPPLFPENLSHAAEARKLSASDPIFSCPVSSSARKLSSCASGVSKHSSDILSVLEPEEQESGDLSQKSDAVAPETEEKAMNPLVASEKEATLAEFVEESAEGHGVSESSGDYMTEEKGEEESSFRSSVHASSSSRAEGEKDSDGAEVSVTVSPKNKDEGEPNSEEAPPLPSEEEKKSTSEPLEKNKAPGLFSRIGFSSSLTAALQCSGQILQKPLKIQQNERAVDEEEMPMEEGESTNTLRKKDEKDPSSLNTEPLTSGDLEAELEEDPDPKPNLTRYRAFKRKAIAGASAVLCVSGAIFGVIASRASESGVDFF